MIHMHIIYTLSLSACVCVLRTKYAELIIYFSQNYFPSFRKTHHKLLSHTCLSLLHLSFSRFVRISPNLCERIARRRRRHQCIRFHILTHIKFYTYNHLQSSNWKPSNQHQSKQPWYICCSLFASAVVVFIVGSLSHISYYSFL